MYPAFASYLRSEGWKSAFVRFSTFGFAEGRRPESHSVRTSLSRTFPHDGQIGLSLIARSTLSSNSSSVVGLRPSAKTAGALARGFAGARRPTIDGKSFGLRVFWFILGTAWACSSGG